MKKKAGWNTRNACNSFVANEARNGRFCSVYVERRRTNWSGIWLIQGSLPSSRLQSSVLNLVRSHLNPRPSSILHSCKFRHTLGPYLALTRPNSPGENMFKFPYLALTRIISHKLAHSRNYKVDSNFNGHNPFNKLQTGPTGKSGPPERCPYHFFSKVFQLDWVFYQNFRKFGLNGSRPISHPTLRVSSQLIHKGKTPKIQIPKIINNRDLEFPIASVARVFHQYDLMKFA